jgi:hypothetical protein
MCEWNNASESEFQPHMRVSRFITCVRRTRSRPTRFFVLYVFLTPSCLSDNISSLSDLLESSRQSDTSHRSQRHRLVNPRYIPLRRIHCCTDHLYHRKSLLNPSRLDSESSPYSYHHRDRLFYRGAICNVCLLRQCLHAISPRTHSTHKRQYPWFNVLRRKSISVSESNGSSQ